MGNQIIESQLYEIFYQVTFLISVMSEIKDV